MNRHVALIYYVPTKNLFILVPVPYLHKFSACSGADYALLEFWCYFWHIWRLHLRSSVASWDKYTANKVHI